MKPGAKIWITWNDFFWRYRLRLLERVKKLAFQASGPLIIPHWEPLVPQRHISFKNKHGQSYRFPLKDVCYIERLHDAVRIVYAPSNWGQRGLEKIQQACRLRLNPSLSRRRSHQGQNLTDAIMRPAEHTAAYAVTDSVILHHGKIMQSFNNIHAVDTDHIAALPGWAQFSGETAAGGRGVFLNLTRIRRTITAPAASDPHKTELLIKFGGTDYVFDCETTQSRIAWLQKARHNALLAAVSPFRNHFQLS